MNQFGVIFDMDGVLVNSYQAHLQSWQKSARQNGLSMSREQFDRLFGRTTREIIVQSWPDRFAAADTAAVAAFDRRKEAAYRRVIQADFPEMDGAGDLLAALHHAGFKLAIGSSGPPENVQVVRTAIRNGQFFDAAVNATANATAGARGSDMPVVVANRTRFHLTGGETRLLLISAAFGVPIQFLLQFHGLALSTVSHASLMVAPCQ